MAKVFSAASIVFIIVVAIIYSASARANPPIRQATNAQMCQADCLQRSDEPGRRAPVRACEIRCGAIAVFEQQAAASLGRRTAVGAPLAGIPAPNGYSVIYAAPSPNSGFAMVVGNADRLSAFRIAEQRCSAAGVGCALIGEFTTVCGAVAQGVRRSPNALFMTSDPSTFVISSISQGSSGTRAGAERDALTECKSKDRFGTCRIVATQCGGELS